MKDKNLKVYLQQSLGEEVQPKRLEETIKLCTEIVMYNSALSILLLHFHFQVESVPLIRHHSTRIRLLSIEYLYI